MSFLHSYRHTWQLLFADKGAILLLLLAGIMYSFYYPLPYSNETVSNVPYAIVDFDQSPSSRQYIRALTASPNLSLTAILHDADELERYLFAGDIMGAVFIPPHFHESLLTQQQTTIQVAGHGGYLLASGTLLGAASEATLTLSIGLSGHILEAHGVPASMANDLRNPVQLETIPLYNPQEGYGSYVVPAVMIMIIQQTLLMGITLMLGTLTEQQRMPSGREAYLGMLAAFSSIGFINCLYFFGFVTWYHNYPSQGQLLNMIVFAALFAITVAAMALWLARFFQNREQGMQLLLATAIPMFFLAGYAWPVEAMPTALQYLRWLLPSTAGIQGFIAINQMGAELTHVGREMAILAGLCLTFVILGLYAYRRQR